MRNKKILVGPRLLLLSNLCQADLYLLVQQLAPSLENARPHSLVVRSTWHLLTTMRMVLKVLDKFPARGHLFPLLRIRCEVSSGVIPLLGK